MQIHTTFQVLTRPPTRGTALFCYSLAVVSIAAGAFLAARPFPGGYDWMYTVISHLGSIERNPQGARWLTGAFFVSLALLWPVVGFLSRAAGSWDWFVGFSTRALQIGLTGGAILAAEGFFGLRLSGLFYKLHEIIALFTFAGFYLGLLGHLILRLRADRRWLVPALLALLPLCAAAAVQLFFYLDQRDLGWVRTEWRAMGIPFWLSYAFWQWTASVLLLAIVGGLSAVPGKKTGH